MQHDQVTSEHPVYAGKALQAPNQADPFFGIIQQALHTVVKPGQDNQYQLPLDRSSSQQH